MKLEINSTRKYKMFNTNEYQPDKRLKATKDLVQSLEITNGNMLCPIIVNPLDMSIVDGHRRLEACQRADVPVYYIELPNNILENRQAIKLLNTTSRQWSTENYLSSYSVDNEEYRKLNNIIKIRNIPVSLITSFTGINTNVLKDEGRLDIDFEELGHKIDVYKAICGIYNRVPTNYVHRALGKLYKLDDFNEERLLSKIEILFESGNIKTGMRDRNFFIKTLCDAYDYKEKTKKHLYYKLIEHKIIKD